MKLQKSVATKAAKKVLFFVVLQSINCFSTPTPHMALQCEMYSPTLTRVNRGTKHDLVTLLVRGLDERELTSHNIHFAEQLSRADYFGVLCILAYVPSALRASIQRGELSHVLPTIMTAVRSLE